MDASGARVLTAGRPAREGDARASDLLPRLDGCRAVDIEFVRRRDDTRPGSWCDAGLRCHRGGDAFRLHRPWRSARAVDPEPRHAPAQAAADVRVRIEGDQCLAAGLRRSFFLEPDPAAALGVPNFPPSPVEGRGGACPERWKEKLIEPLLAASRALIARVHGGARPVAASASRT